MYPERGRCPRPVRSPQLWPLSADPGLTREGSGETQPGSQGDLYVRFSTKTTANRREGWAHHRSLRKRVLQKKPDRDKTAKNASKPSKTGSPPTRGRYKAVTPPGTAPAAPPSPRPGQPGPLPGGGPLTGAPPPGYPTRRPRPPRARRSPCAARPSRPPPARAPSAPEAGPGGKRRCPV